MERTLSLGNLNIVWGIKEEKPFLTHWEDIAWPALKQSSDTKKKFQSNMKMPDSPKYFIDKLNVKKYDGVYYLVGIIVKKTKIDIFSQLDEKEELQETDITETAAPYSVFFMNLSNHKIGLVRSQTGSPNLRNIKMVFDKSFREYIPEYNKVQKEKNPKFKKVNFPVVNMTNLPIESSELANAIKKADSIAKISFEFYPLNNEIMTGKLFELIQDTRKDSISASAELGLKAPENKDGIAEIAKEIEITGTARIHAELRPEKGSEIQKYTNKKRKNSDEILVNAPIKFESDKVNVSGIDGFIKKVKSFPLSKVSFFRVSDENKKIYDNKVHFFEDIFNKMKK